MKVLFVVSNMKIGGGAENSVSIIVKELRKRNHDVELLTFYDFDKEYEVKHQSFGEKYSNSMAIKLFYLFVKFPFKLRSFLKRNKFDLVISNAEDANLVCLIAKKTKLWVVIRNNNLVMFNKAYRTISLHLHKRADKIITVSKGLRDIFADIGFKNASCIYNPLDIESIEKGMKEKLDFEWEESFFDKNEVLVSIGRLSDQKNYFYLLDCFKEVIKEKPHLKLAIFGEGPLKHEIEKYISANGLTENVILMGIRKNIFRYLCRAKLFLLSSKHEGFPRCLLESLACGVPAVSNNCPYGPSEMLGDSKYGMLTNNKEEFVKATKFLLNNEKAYNQYKIKAKLRSKDFDIKKIAGEWEKYLK